MTELAVSKTLLSLSPLPAISFAVVDSATQVSLVNLATFIVATFGTLAGAWIAYRQAQLKKTVDILEHNTNSMKDALVASTAKASLSEGVAQGREEAEAKAAIVTAAKATGSAEEAAKAHKE